MGASDGITIRSRPGAARLPRWVSLQVRASSKRYETTAGQQGGSGEGAWERPQVSLDVDGRHALGVGLVDAVVWVWFLATAYTSRFTDRLADMVCYLPGNASYAVAACLLISVLLLAARWDAAPRRYRVACVGCCCASVTGMLAIRGFALWGTPLDTVVSLLFVASYYASQVLRIENLSRCTGVRTLLCALMVSLVAYYAISAVLLAVPSWLYDTLVTAMPLAFLARFGTDTDTGRDGPESDSETLDWRRWATPATLLLALFGIAGGLLTAAGSTVPARSFGELFAAPSPAYLVMVLAYLALGVLVVRGGAIRKTMFFAAMSVVWMLGTFAGAFVIALFPSVPSGVFALFAGVVALLIAASFVIFRDLWVRSGVTEGDDGAHIDKAARNAGLTKRETEVFRLLATGRSLPYVQERLVISEGTARTHIKHIYAKLGVHSKQELIDLVRDR